jgi:hypothetical protein
VPFDPAAQPWPLPDAHELTSLFYDFRQTCFDFAPEQDFVNVPHVQHVDDPAQNRATIIPLRVMSVNDEQVLDPDVFSGHISSSSMSLRSVS